MLLTPKNCMKENGLAAFCQGEGCNMDWWTGLVDWTTVHLENGRNAMFETSK